MHGILHMHYSENEKLRHFRNGNFPAGIRLDSQIMESSPWRVWFGTLAENPLQIGLYVSNDEGKTHRTYAVVRDFCGKGELFEAKFTAWERAK